jgi:thioredoxin-dependent peroxiredoxin
VIGVSADTQETSDRFKASLGLPYRMVGDPHGAIGRVYKVRWPIIGLFQRVTYVVATNRKVRLAFHSELDVHRHAAKACELFASPAG